jgi:hypothetical protein
MSIDRGLVPTAPRTGYFARAASQAILSELLGKALACGWGEGAPSPSGISGCVAPRQRTLGAATISEISFGICSRQTYHIRFKRKPDFRHNSLLCGFILFSHRRGAASAKLMIGFIQSRIPCTSSKQPRGSRSGTVPSVPHQRDPEGLQAFRGLVLCGTEDQ